MTKKFTYTQKNTGDALSATEWNNLAQDVDAAVDAINAGGVSGGSGVVSTEIDQLDANKTFVKIGNVLVGELTSKGDKGTNVGLSGDNDINIEPRPAAGDGSGKNTPGLANRKGGNIALKPGDDIEFWGHKRGTSKSDEVSVKIRTEVPKPSDPTKTDEVAAKLQLNTADIVLTSKDKQEESDEMNIIVNQNTNTRGYLKVRAQAIDLRCEDHGGIALQPKGTDGQGHMNKIKFEHGGGDGLEFGTFNTEHTSLFTNDYRFNKNGVIKLATRTTVASDKANANDSTTALKYVKADDDFYDNIDNNDPTCTWSDIVEVGSRMDSVNAYYVVPVTYDEQEVEGPNGIAMMVQALQGEFSRINGATAAINDTSFSLSEVFNLDTISATDIQNLEQTSGNTKYVRSNAINTVFGLGTNSVNPTVQQFINTFYQDGKAVFRVGSSMYCLVNSTDVCDFEFQIDDNDKRLSMSDLYTLVSHMKSNGLWTVA